MVIVAYFKKYQLLAMRVVLRSIIVGAPKTGEPTMMPLIATVSEQRLRDDMEDTHCVVPNFAGNKQSLFVGVFDGHGSPDIAVGLARHMPDLVREGLAASRVPTKAQWLAYATISQAEWAQRTDCGSCAATLLVQDTTVTCANVGDCRIIAVGTSARQFTTDHVAKDPNEAQRIAQHGGTVDRGYLIRKGGDGILAVTRAVGDIDFESAGLIHMPDVSSCELEPTDRFVIVASDGLFGKTSNERVLAISRCTETANDLAEALRREVEERNGSDNLTIVVVQVA